MSRDEDHPRDRDAEPPTEQPKTASDAGARRYATVNPYTGETEKEFPFLETGEIDGVIEQAHAAFLEWRRPPGRGARRRRRPRRRADATSARTSFAALVTREMGKRIARRPPARLSCARMILELLRRERPRLPRAHGRSSVMEGRGRRRERAGRRPPGHRAVELPASTRWSGSPGRTWCSATRSCSSTPRSTRRRALAIEKLLPRRRRARGRLHQRLPAHPRRRAGHRRTRSCRASP